VDIVKYELTLIFTGDT